MNRLKSFKSRMKTGIKSNDSNQTSDKLNSKDAEPVWVTEKSCVDGSLIVVQFPKHETFGFQLDTQACVSFARVGFYVNLVSPNSFADSVAKLRLKDLLVAINDVRITQDMEWEDVANMLAKFHKNKQSYLQATFYRELKSINKKPQRIIRRHRRRRKSSIDHEFGLSDSGEEEESSDDGSSDDEYLETEIQLKSEPKSYARTKRNGQDYPTLSKLKLLHIKRGFGPKGASLLYPKKESKPQRYKSKLKGRKSSKSGTGDKKSKRKSRKSSAEKAQSEISKVDECLAENKSVNIMDNFAPKRSSRTETIEVKKEPKVSKKKPSRKKVANPLINEIQPDAEDDIWASDDCENLFHDELESDESICCNDSCVTGVGEFDDHNAVGDDASTGSVLSQVSDTSNTSEFAKVS